jgi:2,5-diamino-6-(ribosylamino)-4(3H)-pyrimidinone 5'-phosphate reductase
MDRPYIILQMAASIDGRITFAPNLTMFDKHPAADLLPDGGPLWKQIETAIEASHHPRGTLMGSGTVQRETDPLREFPPFQGDPRPLYQDFLPGDILQRTTSWAILVDGRGRCRNGYKATENPGCHILHLVSHAAPPEHLAYLQREQIPYLITGQHHADLPEALHKLYAKVGIKSARLWGGGTLNGAMLRSDLIDEIHLIVWPLLLGGRATPTLADCPDLTPTDHPAKLQLLAAHPQPDGHLWLHYKVDRSAN